MSHLRLSVLAAGLMLVSASAMALPSSNDTSSAVRATPVSAPRMAETKTIIGGCPYNLDKVCTRRNSRDRWHCHCAS